ncbi:MAG: PQQ-dependent sugar dehydrogenase [Bacteroidota bacterium]
MTENLNHEKVLWILKNKKTVKVILFFVFLSNQILLSQTFPAGFSQVKVATIADAMSISFAPDGRLFICQKSGSVRIIKNGLLLPIPFLTLSVNHDIERGIIGITFDPNFNVNHYLYIYYTAETPNIHNKLSRFTANGDSVLSGSEFSLLDLEPPTSAFHTGGGIGFGMDGKLYLAVGDDETPNNAQNSGTYFGKVLRLNTDGSTPIDNPYISSNSEITKKIWSYGLRNPYTLSIQPGTGKVFVNDVGSDKWEEINDATLPGKNFGWPIGEGASTNSSYANPVFAYPHVATGQDGCAITGGAFFNPTSSNYPAGYNGKYFYMDWCNGWLYNLTLGSTVTNTIFSSGMAAMNLSLQVGPDGNLYYINRDIAREGVYKIIYSSNNAPVITDQPDNVTVSAGQPATFSISVSGAIPLSYQWRKNGTKITGAISSAYNIPNTVNSDAGQYSVMIKNAYDSVLSNIATLTVTPHNDEPNATITTPLANTYYRAGDVISFSGSGTDTEDGTLPAANFEWTVEFYHNNNHFHPGPAIPSGIKFGSFIIPNTGESSPVVFYRLKLKVTDLNGLVDTTHVDIVPLVSTITMNTFPAGLVVTYDGQPRATIFSTMAVRGMLISIGVISPQIMGGKTYVFKNWQHGGGSSQTILVGEVAGSYTAIFKDTILACTASGTISRDFWANVTGSSVAAVPVNTVPTNTSQLTIFEGPIDFTENYGSRIRGYLCPPITGNYIFWIASDNNSELWLSTNDQPANKVRIASVPGYTEARGWTKYSEQQSAPRNLTAGVTYYIEAIHKEGTQGDNLAVGWQLPNGALERPIPGMRLSPYIIPGNSPPTVNVTSPGNNATYPNPSNIVITATASSSGGSITKVEFYEGTTLIGEDVTAPYSFTWMNVATGNYALKAVATDNANNVGASQVVNITVKFCPTAKITPIGPTTFCSGSVILQSNTGPGYIYQWKKDGVNISGATNSSYTASVSGSYQVKIIQGSCIAWSAPVSVKKLSGLRASITPGGPTTFCSGGNIKLFANTCTGYTYKWKKDGSYITGATGVTYTATTAGNYQLQVTQAGANAWSSQLKVTVNACRESEQDLNENTDQDQSISESSDSLNSFQMKVYPNPNTGLFTIVLNMPLNEEEKVNMKILNIIGQEVYNKEYITKDNYFKETIDLDQSLPTGIYTLQVIIGNKVENTNVVLAR